MGKTLFHARLRWREDWIRNPRTHQRPTTWRNREWQASNSPAYGVLPYFYSRLLDTAATEFLDLFLHRLLSLHYRAWEKHRFHIALESRFRRRKTADPFTSYVLSLVGFKSSNSAQSEGVMRTRALKYANILLAAPKSSVGLRQLIEDYFRVTTQLEQFQLKPVEIAQSDRARLGERRARRSLSDGVLLGSVAWQAASSFPKSRLGRFLIRTFSGFLPGGPAFQDLVALVRHFVGSGIATFQIALILRGNDVREPRIGYLEKDEQDRAVSAMRLGRLWLAWTGFRQGESDWQESGKGSSEPSLRLFSQPCRRGVFQFDHPVAQLRLAVEDDLREMECRIADKVAFDCEIVERRRMR